MEIARLYPRVFHVLGTTDNLVCSEMIEDFRRFVGLSTLSTNALSMESESYYAPSSPRLLNRKRQQIIRMSAASTPVMNASLHCGWSCVDYQVFSGNDSPPLSLKFRKTQSGTGFPLTYCTSCVMKNLQRPRSPRWVVLLLSLRYPSADDLLDVDGVCIVFS